MTRVPRSHDITIPADDGFPLAATLFEPSQARTGVPLVVVGAATAVPRRYYGQFAAFLAAHGHPAITFDYRGVSQSRPKSLVGFDARMRDWGERDCKGVLAWAEAHGAEVSVKGFDRADFEALSETQVRVGFITQVSTVHGGPPTIAPH